MLSNTCELYKDIYIKCLTHHKNEHDKNKNKHGHNYCKYIFCEMINECIKECNKECNKECIKDIK